MKSGDNSLLEAGTGHGLFRRTSDRFVLTDEARAVFCRGERIETWVSRCDRL
jgi:DNA-binding transcriptional LysR family regulator